MSEQPWIEEYIACDCHSEGLLFHHMPSDTPNTDGAFVYVSLWEMCPTGPHNWRHRLGHIWHILRHGTPYLDEIALTKPGVERLRHFCDCALADGVYDRPWVKDLRAGECLTSSAAQSIVVTSSTGYEPTHD